LHLDDVRPHERLALHSSAETPQEPIRKLIEIFNDGIDHQRQTSFHRLLNTSDRDLNYRTEELFHNNHHLLVDLPGALAAPGNCRVIAKAQRSRGGPGVPKRIIFPKPRSGWEKCPRRRGGDLERKPKR